MCTNPNTGKGWTDAEEATFADIMRIARVGRIAAIQLYRRCKSNATKAVKLARDNYGLSDAQIAAYESTKAARLAGLPRARQRRALNRQIQQTEVAA
jgi:demethoxyubiquinone hydroxylase (CLK1/Coq7/Cat5 family)